MRQLLFSSALLAFFAAITAGVMVVSGVDLSPKAIFASRGEPAPKALAGSIDLVGILQWLGEGLGKGNAPRGRTSISRFKGSSVQKRIVTGQHLLAFAFAGPAAAAPASDASAPDSSKTPLSVSVPATIVVAGGIRSPAHAAGLKVITPADAARQDPTDIAHHDATGAAQDPQSAVQALREAAEAGDPDAQMRLADIYRNGRGVTGDPVEAWQWYDRAAAVLPSGDQRDQALASREELGRAMSADQIAEARQRVAASLAASTVPPAGGLIEIGGEKPADRVASPNG